MKIRNFIRGDILTNCYFLIPDTGDRVIVIDPGLDGRGIEEKLLEKGLKAAYIVLTHGHFDHAMGAAYLRRATGAKVVIHQDDAELLADPEKNAAWLYYGHGMTQYPACPADITVSHGDRICLEDISLQVLHTPGHTNGCMCLDTGAELFTGDTLFRGDFGRTDLYGGDEKRLAESLQSLCRIPGDRKVYPGHGSTTHLSTERQAMERFVDYYG